MHANRFPLYLQKCTTGISHYLKDQKAIWLDHNRSDETAEPITATSGRYLEFKPIELSLPIWTLKDTDVLWLKLTLTTKRNYYQTAWATHYHSGTVINKPLPAATHTLNPICICNFYELFLSFIEIICFRFKLKLEFIVSSCAFFDFTCIVFLFYILMLFCNWKTKSMLYTITVCHSIDILYICIL